MWPALAFPIYSTLGKQYKNFLVLICPNIGMGIYHYSSNYNFNTKINTSNGMSLWSLLSPPGLEEHLRIHKHAS